MATRFVALGNNEIDAPRLVRQCMLQSSGQRAHQNTLRLALGHDVSGRRTQGIDHHLAI